MAVSTTTTLNDVVGTEWIEPTFMGYAYDYAVAGRYLKEFDLQGKGSNTVQVPSLASTMGTVGDGGTSVATAFNGTEGTDLSTPTTVSSNSVTITSAEYAMLIEVTDNVGEDSVPATLDGLIQEIMELAANTLIAAYDDDVCALFSSLNGGTAVGSTGVDLTIANVNSAITAIRNNGVRVSTLVGVLAPVQISDLESAFSAASTDTFATYDRLAADYLGVSRLDNTGSETRPIFVLKGVPFFQSGYCDFANTNADRVGAIFTPYTTANSRYTTFGKGISRPFRIEPQRDASARSTEYVASVRWGSGELTDASGVALITDA